MSDFTEEYIDDIISPLDPEKVASYLDLGGSFSKFFNTYEPRTPQLKLTKAISNTFNESGIGVFEAGTGVGKSLAYLLPAIIWAAQNRKRVVISTGTINLQHQLIEKDVPTALKILGSKFAGLKAMLVKGRSNFICLRRLAQTLQENDLFSAGAEELNQIRDWAMETKVGSKSELSFLPTEQVWSSVCSESDNCLANKCPYYSACFVMKMKKEAESSSILIVNHHILFADLSARAESLGYTGTAVLPVFENLIIDEAHTIEEAAGSFFSEEISRFQLHKQINILYRSRRGKQTGLLNTIVSVSNAAELFTKVIALLEQTVVAFNLLEEYSLTLLSTGFSKSISQITTEEKNQLLKHIDQFYKNIYQVNFSIENILNSIDDEKKDDDLESTIKDINVILRRLKGFSVLMEHFLHYQDFPTDAFWFEKIYLTQGEAIRFIQTPLVLAPIMQQSVFMPMDSVICVSATLQIANSFDFWLRRTGLKNFTEKKIFTDFFQSPFPYEKNVVLNIITDIPMPDEKDFQNSVNEKVLNLLEVTQGKSLILFTSYSSLKITAEYVRSKIMGDIEILQQGEDDRMRLLSKFKNNISSCLFATTSFWAGVDVPGESLSHVIVVKLPFSVPSDPIFQAKSELIEKSGGNSFMNLSVPEAIVQFRQGFGRLMRSNNDRGIVTVLDKRILVKRYGSMFLQSIPKTIQCFNDTKNVLNKIECFLYGGI